MELEHIGDRIAKTRRRRGLSQRELAGLIRKSESWVSKIERGDRSVDRLSLLLEIAEALNVDVAALTGQPSLPDSSRHDMLGGVPAIRRVLNRFDRIPGVSSPLERAQLRPVAELRRDVVHIWRRWQAAQYSSLGDVLPGLILEAELATEQHTGDEQRAAFMALAETYHVTADMLMKFGEHDLAFIATERSLVAAERADDPVLRAVGVWHLGYVFHSSGRVHEAKAVTLAAAEALESLRTTGRPEYVALYGALMLKAAIGAARAEDRESAWDLVGQAESAARELANDRNDFWTMFGPTNVAIHGVGIAVELGEPGVALRRAAKVTHPGRVSVERQAHHLIDVARAYGQQYKDADAVRTLLSAERLAAEEVRYQVFAQELVRELRHREQRSRTPGLRGLAERVGVE
jgi:transcriptional regulator with XRE-family HTH domain